MVRQGVAAAAFLAAVTTSAAAAAWTPPLLPGIAARAGGAQLNVHCLGAAEWSAAGLSRGQVAVLRQGRVLVTDHACSVIVGYANALPRVPGPGTPQELEVSRSLYRFLAAAVSRLALVRALADCRTLETFVPAFVTLGVSKPSALGLRLRLLVARKRLHIAIAVRKACSVKLPPAASH